ncbi:MAG: hypothetical protein AB8B88_04895 [Devosiaceae bacterium]
MISLRHMTSATALLVMTMLVAASTVIPSLSYAQRYADHLSQYGGYDARMAALSGFASLYKSPEAPMLPVVLSVPSDIEMAAVLPTPCAVDKTVLTRVAHHCAPSSIVIGYFQSETSPAGLHPLALRGPPRQNA